MAKGFLDGQGPKFLYILIACLLTALAIAIAVLVANDLWYYDYTYYTNGYYYYDSTCFLVSPNQSFNLCYWNWALTAIGIFLSIFILFFSLCNRFRNPKVTGILMLVSAIWWTLTAILNTIYATDADRDTDGNPLYISWQEKKDYRTAVWAMSWAGVGLSFIGLFVSFSDCQNARKYQAQAPPAYTQPGYGAQPNPASYYQPGVQPQGYPAQGYPAAQPYPASQPYPAV